jgi:multidrug transporter EmrE-like cation transporter
MKDILSSIDSNKTIWLTWGIVVLSALFDSYAAFIVKGQFNNLGKINFSSISSVFDYLLIFLKNPILLSAAITFLLAPALWFLALNRLDLSLAYPILVGFHLIFVLFFGVLFLNEPFNLNKILGSICIFISLIFFYKS